MSKPTIKLRRAPGAVTKEIARMNGHNTTKQPEAPSVDFKRLVSDFYIIAGNFQQARDYCQAKGIRYDPSKIIHAPHVLRGREGGHVKLVGTYFDREDWDEMAALLSARGWMGETDDY
jgi:hypothetical protein